MQSFVLLKHTGRVQRRVTHKAEKSPLAEMTLPGKLTLVINVSPVDQVNFNYQFKHLCSEMRYHYIYPLSKLLFALFLVCERMRGG